MPQKKPEVHVDYAPKRERRKRNSSGKASAKKRKRRDDHKACPGLGHENNCVMKAFQIVMKEGSDGNGDPVSILFQKLRSLFCC